MLANLPQPCQCKTEPAAIPALGNAENKCYMHFKRKVVMFRVQILAKGYLYEYYCYVE